MNALQREVGEQGKHQQISVEKSQKSGREKVGYQQETDCLMELYKMAVSKISSRKICKL